MINNMFYFVSLSIMLVIFNTIDIYLTRLILLLGGKKLNPIICKFGMVQVKLVGCFILLLAGYFIHTAILIIPNVMILGVCIWNLIQIGRIK